MQKLDFFRNGSVTRTFGILALMLCGKSFSLTDGPTQPEFQTFLPVDIGDMVNLSTGDFSYTIPLLDIPTADGLGFPLAINYAAGIGINQEATWTGLGWNLNTGSISRVASNIPDDLNGNTLYKKANTEKAETQSHSLLFPGGNVTFASNGHGAGQTSIQAQAQIKIESDKDGAKQSKKRGANYPLFDLMTSGTGFGKDGASKNAPGSNKPLSMRGYNAFGTINGFGYQYSSFTYRFSHDARINQFGFLYKGNNTWSYSAKEVFQFSDSIAMSDESSLYPFLHISDQTMVAGNPDSYVCMAQGLGGTFQPALRNYKWQAAPWNNLLTDDLSNSEVGAFAGYSYSQDFNFNRPSISREDFQFLFLDDPGGAFVPTSYYSPNGDGFNTIDNAKSKKVYPIYGAGTDDANLLTGFKVVNVNGVTYHFTYPLYVYAEYSESSNSQTNIRAGRYTAQFMPEAAGAPNVTAAQLKAMNKPLYAHSWLLTSITGPDYVDKGSAGFDPTDGGYWVKFDYEKLPGGYIYRTPFTGKLSSSAYSLPNDRAEHRYGVSFGKKDVAYLRNITTNRAVVIFDISKRQDGYESGNVVNGGVLGINAYNRLESISMFPNTEQMGSKGANGVWDLGEYSGFAFKKVVFGFDYSLCDNTDNNAVGGGKLTLKSVKIQGKGGASLPPYRFDYGPNPAYSKEKWDRWGFYKEDGSNDPAAPFPRHMDVNPGDVNAWSLDSVTLPFGGNIKIVYESDAYNYVHDMAIGSARKAMGRRVDVNEMGLFYAEDQRPQMPSGDGVYEIRSYAPNIFPAGVLDDQGGVDKVKANIGRYGFYERTLPEEARRELRKIVIYANEIPPGFTVSEIKAYAYVSKGGDSGPGDSPEIGMEMYGFLADGTRVPLNANSPSAIFSPRWLDRTSDRNLPGQYVSYEIFATAEENVDFADPSGLQRDFRIFLIDKTANKLKPGEYMKFGGGLRVKRLEFSPFEGAAKIRKDYFYDTNGDGTGLNSGVASQEPEPYNNDVNDDRYLHPYLIGNLIPVSKVFYGKVTVKESNRYSTQYTFITPRTTPITVRSEGQFLDWDNPIEIEDPVAEGYQGRDQDDVGQERMYNILDRSQMWGLVDEVKERSAANVTVKTLKHFYTTRLGQAYMEYMGPAVLAVQNVGGIHCLHTSKFKNFMPLLERVEETVDNTMVSRYTVYNHLNGLPDTEGLFDPSQNVDRATRYLYAFQTGGNSPVYAKMGHKQLPDDTKLNMLSQLAAEAEVKNIHFGAEEVIKKEVYTWGFSPRSAGMQIHKTGHFRWLRNYAGGPMPSDVFNYQTPPFDNSNPLWRVEAQYTDYDHFGHLLEGKSPNGTFFSAVYGYGSHLQTGTMINVRTNQATVYSGDYENSAGIYLDQENGWERGAGNDAGLPGAGVSLLPRPHFGLRSLSVYNAYGPSRNVEYDRTRPYVFSAWVSPSRGQCKIYVDLRKKNPDGSITVIPNSPAYSTSFGADGKGWRYVETIVPVSASNPQETQYLRGFVGCPDLPSGGAMLVDGIRFTPSDAPTTTYFHDPDLARLIAKVDENNIPTFFEYDGLGFLTAVRNADGAIVQEKHRVYGKAANLAEFW